MKKNGKYIFALDIGSSKMALAGALCHLQTQALDNIFIEDQPSRGFLKGVVNDMPALSEALSHLFKKAEMKTGVKVGPLTVGITGSYIQARHSLVAMALSERGTRPVTKRDMEKLLLLSKILGLELDEELLHEYPLGYSIDRQNMILNPLGLQGRRFEMDSLLVCAGALYLENIRSAIERSGYHVSRFVFSGVASSEAVLSPQEREQGVVLVDIGETLTSVLFYKDSILRCVKILAFGGCCLTEIIARYFKIPLELAGEIKRSSLELNTDIADSEEVMIKSDAQYRSIKKLELARIVLPEIEKFVDVLKDFIEANALKDMIGAQVVVSGGLSLLEGLLERIESGLKLPVKIGALKGIQDISVSRAPSYAAAVGLLYLEKERYQKSQFLFKIGAKRSFFDMVEYFKALYQDYF